MTAIDGDGDPITFGVLDKAVKRVLEYCEIDVGDVRYLLEADEGICADEEDIEASFKRIFGSAWREEE